MQARRGWHGRRQRRIGRRRKFSCRQWWSSNNAIDTPKTNRLADQRRLSGSKHVRPLRAALGRMQKAHHAFSEEARHVPIMRGLLEGTDPGPTLALLSCVVAKVDGPIPDA